MLSLDAISLLIIRYLSNRYRFYDDGGKRDVGKVLPFAGFHLAVSDGGGNALLVRTPAERGILAVEMRGVGNADEEL